METLQERITRMEEIGESIKAKGFQFPTFHEACQLYWNVFLEDTNPFTEQNLKFVSPEELEQALERQRAGDYRRLHALLPKRMQRKVSVERMIETKNQGFGEFLQACQEPPITAPFGRYRSVA